MPSSTHQPFTSLQNQTQSSAQTTRTTTQTQTQTPVLHLRAAAPDPATRRRIQWAEDVVDNEGMGKKKSKVCCIYHAPHPVSESSSESSSSDSDSSDSDNETGGAGDDDGRARLGGRATCKRRKSRGQEHDEECLHGSGGDIEKAKARAKGWEGKKRGNAYEVVPKGGGGKAVEVKS